MPESLTSKLAPFNRPHAPDAATADFLYRVYRLLLEAPPTMGAHAKKRTFENAADGAHSWTVVCISEEALDHLATNGNTKTLRRAHAVSRETRFQDIFGTGAKVWTRDELTAYFFENDTCALVSFDENKRHTTEKWSKLHAVPEQLPGKNGVLFRPFPGSFAVYARKSVEVPWAKALWASIGQPRKP